MSSNHVELVCGMFLVASLGIVSLLCIAFQKYNPNRRDRILRECVVAGLIIIVAQSFIYRYYKQQAGLTLKQEQYKSALLDCNRYVSDPTDPEGKRACNRMEEIGRDLGYSNP